VKSSLAVEVALLSPDLSTVYTNLLLLLCVDAGRNRGLKMPLIVGPKKKLIPSAADRILC
jgi:hypothetical protein